MPGYGEPAHMKGDAWSLAWYNHNKEIGYDCCQ